MSANQDSPCLCPTDKTRQDSCRQWVAHRNHLIYFVLRTKHLFEKTRLTRTVSLKLDLTLIYVIWTKQDKTYTDSVYQTKLTLIISYGQNKFNPHRHSWSIRTNPMSHGLTPKMSTEQKPYILLSRQDKTLAHNVYRTKLTLTMSCMMEYRNIQSSLICSFSSTS